MIVEGEEAVQLDKRVPVRKCHVTRQPDNVRRVVNKVRGNLDHLGRQDPGHHQPHEERLVAGPEVQAGAREGPDEEGIPDRGEADELGDVDGVDAPRVAAPGVRRPQARRAAAPGRPGLAADLGVEGGRVAQGREDLRLGRALEADLPLVAQHPARDVVVVVAVDGPAQAKEVVLAEVARAEGVAVEDQRAEGVGAARHAEHAAVDVGLGADLEVVAAEVDAGEEVGVRLPEAAALGPDDFLVGADEAHGGVLEGCDERL